MLTGILFVGKARYSFPKTPGQKRKDLHMSRKEGQDFTKKSSEIKLGSNSAESRESDGRIKWLINIFARTINPSNGLRPLLAQAL